MKKHPFNLIEITITLGVIGFALLAILGVIPYALERSSDSGAIGNLSHSIESMIDFMAVEIQNSWDEYITDLSSTPSDPIIKGFDFNSTDFPDFADIGIAMAGTNDPTHTNYIELDEDNIVKGFVPLGDSDMTYFQGTFFHRADSSGNWDRKPIYRMIVYRDYEDNDGEEAFSKGKGDIIFDAIVRVWKEPVSAFGYSFENFAGTIPYADENYTLAAALIFEVSWPTDRVPKFRKRAYFRHEIFNHNP